VRRKYAAASTVAVVLIGCVACTSSVAGKGAGAAQRPQPAGRSVAAGASSKPAGAGATGAASVPGGGRSRFCALVHKVGLDDVGLTETPTTGADATKLLAGVDELDAAAPAEIKSDFDVFDKFEHALLDAGTAPDPSDLGSGGPALALSHVAEYLTENCGVGRGTSARSPRGMSR